MKKKLFNLLITCISILFFSSCSKSSDTNSSSSSGGGSVTFSCSGISPKFSTDVQPIINASCSINNSCHASGSSNAGGPLTTYNEVFAKRSNIRAAILARTMPQTGVLSQTEINMVICWIDSGAPNN